MNASLLGYAAAVLSGLDDAQRRVVADELAQLEQTAGTDSTLRAALTDTAIPAWSRRAFVADLLADKVSAATARLAAYAAYSSSAQDVPLAFTEVAQRARFFAADGGVHEPALGVLAARARVGGYATAVFEDLPVATFEGTEDELYEWARAVESTPQLRNLLTNRDLPAPTRAQVVHDLLADRASAITVRLAAYAVVGGRARDLVGTLDWLVDRVAEERGWRIARVRSARPIDEGAREALSGSIEHLIGRPVELEVSEQADLLGGVIVEVGDLRVDASAKGRLDALREHLMADRPGERLFEKNETTRGAN
jgi:F-type H+-transporting ATPase subunit delta